MSEARGQYYIGTPYTGTPTPEHPVWLLVHNYTQRDIDKSDNQDDFLSAAFKSDLSLDVAEPVALLRYSFAHHPARYTVISGQALDRLRRGKANSGNPNGMDLLTYPNYYNDYLLAKDDFRAWWEGLTYKTADSGDASVPDGRASLLSQMVGVGIVGLIERDDIPAALHIIENTTAIKHVSWAIERDILIPMLEARLVNHWHLMTAEQQAKHTQYQPPAGNEPTNSGTGSGTAMAHTIGTGRDTTITAIGGNTG